MKRFCDENCNECSLMRESNSKIVTVILNALHEKFGNDVYKTVQEHCPNLTCCFDCRIDDFCHVEGCELLASAEKYCATKKQSTDKVVKDNSIQKRLKSI